MTSINIYCDEIIDYDAKDYLFLGALFIEEGYFNAIINNLENKRCLNPKKGTWKHNFSDCQQKNCSETWHNMNNTNIHFKEISLRGSSRAIAINWLNLLNQELKNKVKFSILVIDLKKLDCERFGFKKTYLNIYTKFFRTMLNGAIKHLFYNEKVTVKEIYHHWGSQEKLDYFSKSNIEQLNIEIKESVNFSNKEIIFIADDHRKYFNQKEFELIKHAQLIQLIDLILGSFKQLFLNPQGNDEKKEVAENLRPLVISIFKNKNQVKHSISFFPKYSTQEILKINQKSVTDFSENKTRPDLFNAHLKIKDNFYNTVKLNMPNYDKKQALITQWVAK